MNLLVKEAKSILSEQNFEYAFCGGFAIDLFLGYESRKHSDIDILAYWEDRNLIILYMQLLGFHIYEMLGEGKTHHIIDINNQKCVKRNIFCVKDSCELVQLSITDEKEIYYINFQHIGQSKLNFVEFLFNNKEDTDFLYARNHSIKRNLSKAILIPYLAPELCLLYKSTDTERDSYQHDYNFAIAKMNSEQKDWFNHAVKISYPEEHKWSL